MWLKFVSVAVLLSAAPVCGDAVSHDFESNSADPAVSEPPCLEKLKSSCGGIGLGDQSEKTSIVINGSGSPSSSSVIHTGHGLKFSWSIAAHQPALPALSSSL